MKLYFSPGACSLAPNIILREAGFSFEIEKVDVKEKKTASGADYLKINPNGYVPALQLDNGEVLTEAGVILQYVADQKPEKKLIPAAGTLERYRLLEWLNFITSEVHKGFSPLFKPTTPEDYKPVAKELLGKRLDHVAARLTGRDYLMGANFTIVDAYLYTVLGWSRHVGMDLERWPSLVAYRARIKERPTVQAAQAAESGK